MAESQAQPPVAFATSLQSIPGLRQMLLLVGLAAAIAVGTAIALWSQSPNYRVLFPNVDQSEVGAIVSVLETADIEHRFDVATGALLVEASKANRAQMLLAGQGLPQSRGVTLESLYDGQGYSTSQYMEGRFYSHALEAKLSSVVASLNTIKAAQVSLGLPRQSVFLRDRKEPTASVVVHMYPGRSLEPGQAKAIVHLVASSVPGLSTSNVTLLDENGTLLSEVAGDALGAASNEFDYKRRVEQALTDNIDTLLLPIMGPGRSRTKVVAQLDFTDMEETAERFDPASQVVRSEQSSEQQSSGAVGALGVPGALSNQPPVTPVGAAQAPGAATAQQTSAPTDTSEPPPVPRSSARDTILNYEVDRTVSRKRAPKGRIERLSVAVVLDHLPPAGGGPNAAPTPLSADQLKEITGLVKEAVGYDEDRGDTLNLINVPFQTAPPLAEADPLPIWEQPWALDIAKIMIGAMVVLALAILVLKPLVQGLLKAPAPPLITGPGPALDQPGALTTSHVLPRDDPLQIAQNIATNDPKRIAQVVKDWVAADE